MCFANELFQLFASFHRSSSVVMVFFHLPFSFISPLVPLFPEAKAKIEEKKKSTAFAFQYNSKKEKCLKYAFGKKKKAF